MVCAAHTVLPDQYAVTFRVSFVSMQAAPDCPQSVTPGGKPPSWIPGGGCV